MYSCFNRVDRNKEEEHVNFPTTFSFLVSEELFNGCSADLLRYVRMTDLIKKTICTRLVLFYPTEIETQERASERASENRKPIVIRFVIPSFVMRRNRGGVTFLLKKRSSRYDKDLPVRVLISHKTQLSSFTSLKRFFTQ